MIKNLWPLAIMAAFCVGWVSASLIAYTAQKQQKLKRVTSRGGVFFKCKNPLLITEWYAKHPGLDTDQYGTNFEWRRADDCTKKGFTQWGAASQNTRHLHPSYKDFMIIYRGADLGLLAKELWPEKGNILDSIQPFSDGKFIHILDIEGNKIELRERNEVEYDKDVDGRSKLTLDPGSWFYLFSSACYL